MKILLATISPRRSASKGPAAELVQMYLERSRRYLACERQEFSSEDALLAFLSQAGGRTKPAVILTDSKGKQLTSEEFAGILSNAQDNGTQLAVIAIGPADGWSAEARKLTALTFAFGRITLPHELAAVLAAEQIYRALTIRAGHPYHSGH